MDERDFKAMNNEPIKYEFVLLRTNNEKMDEYAKQYQDAGWELAGGVEVSYDLARYETYVIIPFKRKL